MENKVITTERIEKEVKFKIDSISEIRQRLKKIGALFVSKAHENTIMFDDTKNSILRMGANFRLREGRKTELTFKEKPDRSEGVRSSKEFTVEIKYIEVMKAILKHLGFNICQRFQKEREYWQYEDTIICIDILPIGIFLEVEGEKKNIKELAHLLNLDFNKRILKHYGEIWEEYCKKHGIIQRDIVF